MREWLARWLLLPLVVGLMRVFYLLGAVGVLLGMWIEERIFCPLEWWVHRVRDGE